MYFVNSGSFINIDSLTNLSGVTTAQVGFFSWESLGIQK